jgi:hypothetical protein
MNKGTSSNQLRHQLKERDLLQQYQCTALFSHPTTLQQQWANLTARIRMAAAVLGAL